MPRRSTPDAVAAANILAGPLRDGRLRPDDLGRVQRRRELPTRVIGRVLGRGAPLALPWPLRLLRRFPFLRRVPARLIGMGFRPEHVRTLDTFGTH